MADNPIDGVFNVTEHFPGRNLIRLNLSKDKAWEILKDITRQLEKGDDQIALHMFGRLYRDGEEDTGQPNRRTSGHVSFPC